MLSGTTTFREELQLVRGRVQKEDHVASGIVVHHAKGCGGSHSRGHCCWQVVGIRAQMFLGSCRTIQHRLPRG